MGSMRNLVVAVVLTLGVCGGSAAAGEATVATASNFAFAAERIARKFQAQSGHVITLVSSSTGKLAAQVTFGAPFDVLLAADQARPKRLLDDGHAVKGSRFTYTQGRLVLWGGDAGKLKGASAADILKAGQYKRVSIANPDVAPYGAAARQVLNRLGLGEAIKDKLIYGENIQQAYAFAASGNTDLALVALSFMRSARLPDRGAYSEVPSDLHEPILQDAVLLKRGRDNPAAIDFLAFLKTPEALLVMKELGYAGEVP